VRDRKSRTQRANFRVTALAQLTERVELSREGVRISLKPPNAAIEERGDTFPSCVSLTKFVRMQMKRRGVETRLVLGLRRPGGLWLGGTCFRRRVLCWFVRLSEMSGK
jgi:hypothetical protein